jgi:hypothetical protein
MPLATGNRRMPAIAPVIAFMSTSQERHRRLVVRLITIVYWLLIFEGVLRKWIFPQWGRQLFFIRDPFVLLAYALVVTKRTRISGPIVFEIWGILGFAGLVSVVVHGVMGGGASPLLAAYGWRNYFLYMPLSFVIARYFHRRDLERIVKGTLVTAILMAGLVTAQITASKNAPINAGSGANPDDVYKPATTTGGVVRAAGTFTSDLALTAFVTSSLCMAIAVWVMPARLRPVRLPLLLTATASLVTCLGVSGSRGALLWAAAILCAAIAGLSVVGRDMQFKAIAAAVAIAAVGFAVIPVAFPHSTEAFVRRWDGAGMSESRAYGSGGVFARAVYEIIVFRTLIGDAPALGYGLGTAGNAAWILKTRGQIIPFYSHDQFNAAETDWGRNLLELGPVLGFSYILFRVTFVIWLAGRALKATRSSGNPFPWLFAVYVGALISYGEMTANGTLNGYAWVFAGFCMAATQSLCNNRAPRWQTGARKARPAPLLGCRPDYEANGPGRLAQVAEDVPRGTGRTVNGI